MEIKWSLHLVSQNTACIDTRSDYCTAGVTQIDAGVTKNELQRAGMFTKIPAYIQFDPKNDHI
eukprot:5318946-Pyramimonas_sp.AAC.1